MYLLILHILFLFYYNILGIGFLQVIWYPRPVLQKERRINYGTIIDSQDYSVPFEDRNIVIAVDENIQMTTTKESTFRVGSSHETSYASSYANSQTVSIVAYFRRLKEKVWWQILILLYLFIALILLAVGLGFTVNTFWAIFGPVSMFAVLFITSLFRDYKEGNLSCYFWSDMRYRLFGTSL